MKKRKLLKMLVADLVAMHARMDRVLTEIEDIRADLAAAESRRAAAVATARPLEPVTHHLDSRVFIHGAPGIPLDQTTILRSTPNFSGNLTGAKIAPMHGTVLGSGAVLGALTLTSADLPKHDCGCPAGKVCCGAELQCPRRHLA